MAPPALRDALWQVMSGLPGTSVEVEKKDSRGRSGERVTHEPEEGRTVRLLYDAGRHRLLESDRLGIDGEPLERAGPPRATYAPRRGRSISPIAGARRSPARSWSRAITMRPSSSVMARSLPGRRDRRARSALSCGRRPPGGRFSAVAELPT